MIRPDLPPFISRPQPRAIPMTSPADRSGAVGFVLAVSILLFLCLAAWVAGCAVGALL